MSDAIAMMVPQMDPIASGFLILGKDVMRKERSMKNEEANAIRRSGLTDIELEQVSGGCNNGHEPQWKPVACNHPGCSEIVKVDVANQSSFKCPKGHINVISKE